jgi:hypothetical protein
MQMSDETNDVAIDPKFSQRVFRCRKSELPFFRDDIKAHGWEVLSEVESHLFDGEMILRARKIPLDEGPKKSERKYEKHVLELLEVCKQHKEYAKCAERK